MSSAWNKYVTNALAKERQVIFDDAELQTIEQVKKALKSKNLLHTWDACDHELKLNLVRGFAERKNPVKDIAATTEKIFEWKKENGIDTILDKRLPLHDVYHNAWPSYIGGEDIYGHWMVLDRVSELQVSLLTKYEQDVVLLYRAQVLETFVRLKQEISLRLGHRVCQYIYSIDLKGLSMNKHFGGKVRAILQPLFAMSGDMYPDSLWSLFIINAPLSFRAIWRIISPWIDPVVKPKIRILSGKSAYLPAMQKTGIPLESIPDLIGGKSSDYVTAQHIVEELIDNPDVENHGFTCNPAKSDPAAAAAHKKAMATLAGGKRNSITKRLSKSLGRGKKSSDGSSTGNVARDIVKDGENIYNGDDVIMQGFLLKRGVHNKAWKKRYFVLTPSGLFYFAGNITKENHVPKGKIELQMITTTHLLDKGKDGFFNVVTPDRAFELRVDKTELGDGDDMPTITKSWIENITNSVENDICALDVAAISDDSHQDYVHRGFVKKKGAFNQAWRRRYVVLTSHALYYYTDNPTQVGSSLKGRIELYKVSGVDRENVSEGNHEFAITVPGRVYHLCCETEEQADEWLRKISSAVEKEQTAVENAKEEEDTDDEMPLQPPVLRTGGEEEEEVRRLGRSNSTIVTQITTMAAEFLSVAGDMGLLRQSDDLPDISDEATMMATLRKRAYHMFKLF